MSLQLWQGRDDTPVGGLHHRSHSLPPTGVGYSDHQGVRYSRVRLEGGFDLLGIYLLPAGIDAEATSSEEPDGIVCLDRRHVSGQGPAGAIDDDKRPGRAAFV